ncbi:MAG TPA: hypothetical protein PKD70_12545 [Saprospiraceae bacterium]|nr:hypothetical protein [Saprospiraceae bacterium]HMP14703.1 hypothetical protein [Saprospiraceae bacterium]
MVFLIAWQLLLKGGVLMWYGLNQTYITNELCENRDRPELACNGKCILMQRLQAAEQERRDAQERPLRIVEKLELAQFIIKEIPISNLSLRQNTTQPQAPDVSIIKSACCPTIFQPPEA